MFLVLFLCLFLVFPFSTPALMAHDSIMGNEEILREETEKITALSLEYAKFYELPQGMDLWEITDDLLTSHLVKEREKQSIRDFDRRFFVFHYPSDGLKIKGIISFVSSTQENPLLVLLRGGNNAFGILNPGGELFSPRDYTVISTLYRGGICEGVDEFGGQDVNDVKNLIAYIPQLEEKLHVVLQSEKVYMLGVSRGAMQMFLTLDRFPELQNRLTKIVSLSGVLDIQQWVFTRPDMKKRFIEDFGLIEGVNEEEWINWRDPILTIHKINLTLPILIIQGTEDTRVDLQLGHHMVKGLHERGHNVTYWEIEGGDHGLRNRPDTLEKVLNWLEESPIE